MLLQKIANQFNKSNKTNLNQDFNGLKNLYLVFLNVGQNKVIL